VEQKPVRHEEGCQDSPSADYRQEWSRARVRVPRGKCFAEVRAVETKPLGGEASAGLRDDASLEPFHSNLSTDARLPSFEREPTLTCSVPRRY
jgi:hypothetical protein